MSTEVVDGWAVKQLRELYRLDRTHVARLCGLTMGQVKQLEEGGYDSFGSPADKIQAAMRLAATLSGKQANGLPRANIFYIGNSPVLGNRYTARPGVSLKQERFIDSPKFLKSTLIAFVMLFLLFGVATPILFGKKSAPYLDGVPVIEKLPVIK
jgi:transcriptional regulator with XRE-family HTH domain